MTIRGRTAGPWIKISIYSVLVVVSLLLAFPYFWMVITTFKPPDEVYTSEIRLLPSRFSLGVYPKLLSNPELPVARFFLNSLIISGGCTLVSVGTAVLAAYPLARRPLRGRRLAYLLIISTMMVPGEVVIIGMFSLIKSLHMINTYQGVILPLAVYAIIFLVIYNYIYQLPRELDEAAIMDGATMGQILLRIIIPISRPAIYSATLLAFLHAWQNFTIPYILTLSQEMYPLSVGALFTESTLYATMQETLSLTTILTVPTLLLFLLTQRFVFSGITSGAVKG